MSASTALAVAASAASSIVHAARVDAERAGYLRQRLGGVLAVEAHRLHEADAAAGAVVHAEERADGVRERMRNAQARAERDASERRGDQHALARLDILPVGDDARQVLGDQPDLPA
jgi:hypothetical protein